MKKWKIFAIITMLACVAAGPVIWSGKRSKVLTQDGFVLKDGNIVDYDGNKNYIANGHFEVDVKNWTVYDDGAVDTPADGSGGTATVLSKSLNTSTPLAGVGSMQISKSASSCQGEGYSYDFTIDEEDKNSILRLELATNNSANYVSNDFGVWIYDKDNTTLIEPSSTILPYFSDADDGVSRLALSWESTDADDYRIILHCRTTNASSYTINLDSVFGGPGRVSYGAAVTVWETFTPSFSTDFTYTTAYAYKRRVGENMEIDVSIDITGAGSTGDNIYLTVPDSLNISNATDGQHLCEGIFRHASGVENHDITCVYDGTGMLMRPSPYLGASNRLRGSNVGAGDDLFLSYSIPIAEWQGTGAFNSIIEDNLEEWTSFTPEFVSDSDAGLSPSTSIWEYRRVGDTMEIKGTYIVTGDGTDASVFEFSIPGGYTHGYNASEISQDPKVGEAELRLEGGTDSANPASVRVNSQDELFIVPLDGSTVSVVVGTDMGTSSGRYSRLYYGPITVKIAEWAGSQRSIVGFSGANENHAGLVSRESKGSKSADSSFTAGTFKYARVGNIVTISSDSLTNTSATSAFTSSGFLPETYRPNDDVSDSAYSDSVTVVLLRVTTAGQIQLHYYTPAGSTANRTGVPDGISISYVVD
jgi:hypothetical protein